MYVVIAIALLVMLFVQIGKKNKLVPKNTNRDDIAWIDELEITTDFSTIKNGTPQFAECLAGFGINHPSQRNNSSIE